MPEKTAIQVLQEIWWIGALALGVSIVVTPIVRYIAYRTKLVDRPDDLLKPHGKPVAYLGGVAMCLGLLVGLAGYMVIMPGASQRWGDIASAFTTGRFAGLLVNPLWNLLAIALASVVITIVGLLDDVTGISPRQKVLGQVLAGTILLAGGVGDKMAMVGFSLVRFTPPVWILFPLSVFMCVVVVIAACNATNLLDGLDGLCGGVTGIIAIGFLVLAVWLAMWDRSPGTDELRVALCLAMAGTVLGFLPYNIPPASIFMGDAGSMLLGFFVATMMALFCQEGNARWFVAACAVFVLPIVDTGLAVVRRVLSGDSIFAGDRSHLYDQLVDRGMTIKQVVVLFYILATLAGVMGVVVAVYVRVRYAVLMYAVLSFIAGVVFLLLGMITPQKRQSKQPSPNRGEPE
ncbi:MAG: undecaprenyl/decaprenyl-phosphate alpha-N-acetylglucosaminyl 1-phosphate transferase [Phycisphaerae bacterium]|nr:undecaprenyl/decaprenyl-phosphate alpha-N-acetylglucosaminyl 1-phosphate transferase [Phycisphaerae bacterium]